VTQQSSTHESSYEKLYRDSFNRQKRQEENLEKKQAFNPQSTVVLNQKSDRYVFKKVEREFNKICAQLELSSQIPKEELFELLVKIGYLKPVE